MSKFDDFDLILSDFNKVEERLFLSAIKEFAELDPDVVTKTYGHLLKTENLNIQLKYLVLKSIGQLKYKEFIPMIKEVLVKEEKVRLIIEAIHSLMAIGTLPAFKVAVDHIATNKNLEQQDTLEKIVRAVFTKNQLFYHFDLFYRDRGDTSGIEKSSEFLIRHLPDEHIKDILPALTSKYYKIRYEMLHLLKHRPSPLYYTNIYLYFKENFNSADEDLFLLMSEAMIACAVLSKASSKVFQQLKEHVAQLKGNKKILFCITLLKLNTQELLHFIASVYPKLNFERKQLILTNFNRSEYVHYIDFLRELLSQEHNEILLAHIIEIMTQAEDFDFLFDTIDREKGMRKAKILNILLDHVNRDHTNIGYYIRRYVNPNQENKILYLALEYLLKNSADADFPLIKSIFFAGLSADLKVLIVRNINKLDSYHQTLLIDAIFQDISVIRTCKKDFVFSLLGVMNAKVFDQEKEGKMLNYILVMMEEAQFDEIVNFVYFFDRYEIRNAQDSQLIIDEFRLIQNTLLKSNNDENLVRMIHILTRKIEKKMILKK